MSLPRLFALMLVAAGMTSARGAAAFPWIVKSGETLASISETVYGKIQHERLLVEANFLEALGGSRIVPGMQLDVPAPRYHVVKPGETWQSLAEQFLGAQHRAFVLSMANGSKPWLTPQEDSEILIPYNLRVVSAGTETVVGAAFKFMGDRKMAWTLTEYNDLKGVNLTRGQVILVPLIKLELTEKGRSAAQEAARRIASEGAGTRRAAQQRVAERLPTLLSRIRTGSYVQAVALGNQLLDEQAPDKLQRAVVYRQLLEAYAALDAEGDAMSACKSWFENDPSAQLDPVRMSPKLMSACHRVGLK